MYSLRYQRSWAAAFQLIIFRCLDSESCLWVPEQEWRVAFFFAEQAENNGWWEGREKCIDNCDRCAASALHWHFPSPSKTGSCWPWDVLVRAFFRNVPPRGGLNKIQKNLRRRPVRAQFKNTSLIHWSELYTYIWEVQNMTKTRHFLKKGPDLAQVVWGSKFSSSLRCDAHSNYTLRGYHTNPGLIALFHSWPSIVNSCINT